MPCMQINILASMYVIRSPVLLHKNEVKFLVTFFLFSILFCSFLLFFSEEEQSFLSP